MIVLPIDSVRKRLYELAFINKSILEKRGIILSQICDPPAMDRDSAGDHASLAHGHAMGMWQRGGHVLSSAPRRQRQELSGWELLGSRLAGAGMGLYPHSQTPTLGSIAPPPPFSTPT